MSKKNRTTFTDDLLSLLSSRYLSVLLRKYVIQGHQWMSKHPRSEDISMPSVDYKIRRMVHKMPPSLTTGLTKMLQFISTNEEPQLRGVC